MLHIRASWSRATIDASNRVLLSGNGFSPSGSYLCLFVDVTSGVAIGTQRATSTAYLSEVLLDCGATPGFAVGSNGSHLKGSFACITALFVDDANAV